MHRRQFFHPTKILIRICMSICGFIFFLTTHAQVLTADKKWEDPRLNTARQALYLRPEEREMICEINRVRSDPPRYARLFIEERLKNAAYDSSLKATPGS